ncbi:MAG: phospholipase, partial [Gemmatimonadota bacterium]
MNERHIRVTRTARYCTLGDAGPATRQVWLVCHGYGQLAARFLRRFSVLDDGHRYMVAPEALNRFYIRPDPGPHGPGAPVGATWMTREDRLREIEDYVGYLDALTGEIFSLVDRAAVEFIALGFSQGVATICRWAERAPIAPDRIVLWAGSLPDELTASPRLFGDAGLTLVLGDRDPYAEGGADRRIAERFEA